MMLKSLVQKSGLIYATIFTAGISIIVSLVITVAAMLWFDMPHLDFAIWISIICPLVIATPISYFCFRLLEQVSRSHQELQISNQKLELALEEVKELSGLLPICASCKRIRDDKGYWNQIESYLGTYSKAKFSHSICPECAKKLYPQFYSNDKE